MAEDRSRKKHLASFRANRLPFQFGAAHFDNVSVFHKYVENMLQDSILLSLARR